jgi:hypothetical protein
MRKFGCSLVVAKTCGRLWNKRRLDFCIGGRIVWVVHVARWIKRFTVTITVRGIQEHTGCWLPVWLLVWLLFCDASLLLYLLG